VHDWDSLETPVLIDATFRGQPRKLLVQANRTASLCFSTAPMVTSCLSSFVDQLDCGTGLDATRAPDLTPDTIRPVKGTTVSVDNGCDELASRRPTVRIPVTCTSSSRGMSP